MRNILFIVALLLVFVVLVFGATGKRGGVAKTLLSLFLMADLTSNTSPGRR